VLKRLEKANLCEEAKVARFTSVRRLSGNQGGRLRLPESGELLLTRERKQLGINVMVRVGEGLFTGVGVMEVGGIRLYAKRREKKKLGLKFGGKNAFRSITSSSAGVSKKRIIRQKFWRKKGKNTRRREEKKRVA